MLQGINIFSFFKFKSDRRFDNTDNKDYIAIFDSKKIPSFIVITDLTIEDCVFRFTSIIGNSTVYSGVATKINYTDKTVFYFTGHTFVSSKPCDHYEFELTIGDDVYYSEPVLLTDDLADLVKFSIDSSDMTYNAKYMLPFSSLDLEFYLNTANEKLFQEIIEPQVNENGVEKPYGDIPAFSTVNIVNKIEIAGTAQIFRYLSFLRAIGVNGSITITKNGIESLIYNTEVSEKENVSFGEYIQIIFSYREYNFLSSRNAI